MKDGFKILAGKPAKHVELPVLVWFWFGFFFFGVLFCYWVGFLGVGFVWFGLVWVCFLFRKEDIF